MNLGKINTLLFFSRALPLNSSEVREPLNFLVNIRFQNSYLNILSSKMIKITSSLEEMLGKSFSDWARDDGRVELDLIKKINHD